jgi:hypothetical protein
MHAGEPFSTQRSMSRQSSEHWYGRRELGGARMKRRAYLVRRSSEHLDEISATESAEVLLAKMQSLLPVRRQCYTTISLDPFYAVYSNRSWEMAYLALESRKANKSCLILRFSMIASMTRSAFCTASALRLQAMQRRPYDPSTDHTLSVDGILGVRSCFDVRVLTGRDPLQDLLFPVLLALLRFRGHLLGDSS